MPVYLGMLSSYTLDNNGAKSVVIKTWGYENIHAVVMLVVLAFGSQLPLHVILNCKTMPKEQLPRGVIVRCQTKCWMTNECIKDWLLVVWNRRPGALVLDTFKGHLTPGKKATITGSSTNTDPVVVTGGMTSQMQVLNIVVNKLFRDHLTQLYCE